jgi:hypothetical protein
LSILPSVRRAAAPAEGTALAAWRVMEPEKRAPRLSAVEVLDRVLDRGIVIDARIQVSVAGIELIAINAQVVVSSLAADLDRPVSRTGQAAAPPRPERGERGPVSRRGRMRRPEPAGPRQSRRRRGRARPRTRCAQGCTFESAPGVVACPYTPGRHCVIGAG